MKIIKECGKSMLGVLAFLVAFIVFAFIDEWVGYWLTDHSVTKGMLNFAITGAMMLVMRLLKADLLSCIMADMGVLIFAECFDNGYSFILPITMMYWLYMKAHNEKGGAE